MIAEDYHSQTIKNVRKVWNFLTAPSSQLKDIGQRWRSQLLSSFLLIAAGIFTITVVYRFATTPRVESSLPQITINFFATIVVYGFSRSRSYIIAAIMATAIVPTAVLNNIFHRPSISEIEVSLIMLILGLLISIMLLPAWGTVIFSFVNLGSIVVLPILMPDIVRGYTDD